jgi:6-phosphogluconate dehydrogenase
MEPIKKIGIMGLGKMGKGIALNLIDHGFEVHAFNRSPEPLAEVVAAGAIKAESLPDMAKQLGKPRVLWFMLTAGAVLDDVLANSGVLDALEPGDIIIDGGNSNFNDSVARHAMCKERGIFFLDAGVSGGPAGARSGAAIMVGGDREAYDQVAHVFKALSVENGYGYMGPSGSGHFVKMVHNAIEYGMLQAMGEGYELIHSGPYKNLDLREVTKVWQNGTVIRGFLMDLMARAYGKNPTLDGIKGYIEDNGEGKWAVETALDANVPFVLNTYALMFRYITRQDESFAAQVVASLRHEFGGHATK